MKEIIIGLIVIITLFFVILKAIAIKGQNSIDEYWDEQKRKGGI